VLLPLGSIAQSSLSFCDRGSIESLSLSIYGYFVATVEENLLLCKVGAWCHPNLLYFTRSPLREFILDDLSKSLSRGPRRQESDSDVQLRPLSTLQLVYDIEGAHKSHGTLGRQLVIWKRTRLKVLRD
jgi:hypothetical protein